MVPGVLASEIACFAASPDRGRICASYPAGSAIANPHGIAVTTPGTIFASSATAAWRSIPTASLVWYVGSGRFSPPGSRLIFTSSVVMSASVVERNHDPLVEPAIDVHHLRADLRRDLSDRAAHVHRISADDLVFAAEPGELVVVEPPRVEVARSEHLHGRLVERDARHLLRLEPRRQVLRHEHPAEELAVGQ